MKRQQQVHVSLTLKNFIELVRGGIVEQDGARIILQDIGWDIMLEAVYIISSQNLPYYSDKSSTEEIEQLVLSKFFGERPKNREIDALGIS